MAMDKKQLRGLMDEKGVQQRYMRTFNMHGGHLHARVDKTEVHENG